jgi:hypothetical protein
LQGREKGSANQTTTPPPLLAGVPWSLLSYHCRATFTRNAARLNLVLLVAVVYYHNILPRCPVDAFI